MIKKSNLNKDYYGYIFIAPFIIVFTLFSLYPILNTFYLSFTNAKLMTGLKGDFIGLGNYTLLFQTDSFVNSVKNTWIIWILNFIPQIGFALFLSVMFTNRRLNLKGVGLYKTVFYLPNLLMPATIAAFFSAFLSLYGPVNQFLVTNGILKEAINFLNSGDFAKATVIFIQWWMWFGQTTIVIMAGMTSISPSYYESAMIDGATQTHMFKSITLPLLKPILVYTMVTSLVGGLQMFDIPFLLTNGRGDPEGSIMTLNVLMHLKRTSAQGDIGAAAAVSIMIFIMSSACAYLIFKFLQNDDDASTKKRKKVA